MKRASLLLALAACGGSSATGFDSGTTDQPDADMPPPMMDAGLITDSGPVDTGAPDVTPEPITVVYGHSPSVLYKLDPKTNAVSVVGPFDCSSSVIDLAIDANNNAFITSFSGFYSLDLKTAKCKLIASGNYPNSLSFVPKGTLDQNQEALVGYNGSQYIRIDTKTGAITSVGALSGGYSSSGDIVSVINGGTFLTVNGPNCNTDCLLQVDPKTGNLIKNWGPTGFSQVWGIAFWGGAVYGFTNQGELFQITAQNNMLKTMTITIPNKPMNLQFWGAGSSTSNPTTGVDGGLPPN